MGKTLTNKQIFGHRRQRSVKKGRQALPKRGLGLINYSDQEVADLLIRFHGNRAAVADVLGCDKSYLARSIRDSEELRAAQEAGTKRWEDKIFQLLEKNDGCMAAAAKEMGIGRWSLRELIYGKTGQERGRDKRFQKLLEDVKTIKRMENFLDELAEVPKKPQPQHVTKQPASSSCHLQLKDFFLLHKREEVIKRFSLASRQRS